MKNAPTLRRPAIFNLKTSPLCIPDGNFSESRLLPLVNLPNPAEAGQQMSLDERMQAFHIDAITRKT